MAGKSYAFELDLLRTIFNQIDLGDIARNAATPATNLYACLHTGDPSVLAKFTGTISGTTLTAGTPTEGTIRVGQLLYWPNLTSGTSVVSAPPSIVSGSGTTWTISSSQTVSTSTNFIADGSSAVLETTYGSYARVPVARTSSGWTVTGNVVTPVNAIQFAQASSGTATITHFSLTTGATAGTASKMLYSGLLDPAIGIAVNVTPRITPSSTITET